MELFKQVITQYGWLVMTLVAAIGIIKVSLSISSSGFKPMVSRLFAFLAAVAILAYLTNPFLNWLFVRMQANVGNNLFAQSAVQLTMQTADLIQNAEVSGEPLALDTSEIEFRTMETEPQAATQRSEEPTNLVTIREATSNLTSNRSNAPMVYSLEYQATLAAATPTQIPLVFKAAQNTPTVSPVVKPTTVPLMLMEAQDGGGPNEVYTVKRGDSLAKVAAKYNVNVNQLCQVNNLRDCNVVAVGKKLVIP